MAHIVLVRHGESFGNLTGDYSTSKHDNLTDTGWTQARVLAAHWEGSFDRWLVSPLGRTRQTALPTLQRFGARAELWPDLAECCWQEPRSSPLSDPELPLVPVPLEAHEEPWFAGDSAAVPPEHETWQDGLRRMRRAADRLATLCREGHRLLVVSHGYAISKLVMLLTGQGDLNEVYDVVNTGVTRLVPRDQHFVVEEFNRRPEV